AHGVEHRRDGILAPAHRRLQLAQRVGDGTLLARAAELADRLATPLLGLVRHPRDRAHHPGVVRVLTLEAVDADPWAEALFVSGLSPDRAFGESRANPARLDAGDRAS